MPVDYFLRRDGRALAPLALNLELTARCNLRCPMCWLWGKGGVGSGLARDELDTVTWERVIDDVGRFRPFIYLQGGEVLLRNDAAQLMRRLTARHLAFGFTTNATLVNQDLAREIVRHATAVTVSLDGPAERHNRIRGPGSFERAVQGLQHLLAARGSASLPAIKLNTLYPELTAGEIVEMIRFGAELGVDAVKLGDLQYVARQRAEQHRAAMRDLFGIECRSIDGYVAEPDIDVPALWDKLTAVPAVFPSPRLNILAPRSVSALRRWYVMPVEQAYRRCLFPWFSAMIRANGDVVPCGEYRQPEFSAGSVCEQPFSVIWNDERMRQFRRTLSRVRFFPGCDRCCGLESYGQ
jgi:radical SAM protein with 4Fe4S-binding SPASM domain